MNPDAFLVIFAPAVIAAVLYACAEYKIRKTMEDPYAVIAVAAATSFFFAGGYLVWIALLGDISKLPSYWRGLVGFAGLVGAVFSFQKIMRMVQTLRATSARSAKADSGGANGGDSGANPDA